MRQNIQPQPEYHSAFLESPLSEYFRHAGERFAEESAVFSSAVRSVLSSEGHLTNKAIILWLIQTLEATDDVVRADVIRKTLEIVVGYTMDDL
ncbi:biofilm development regulator YmgB/AriR family protein [Enterobacter soli]|uniref:biofilm development regulator YmgB/AriR family protein n=1 Tax=Enterobacter soli TaxID=885040 RepID=UPI0034CD2DF0